MSKMMKRTILILLAILTLLPATLWAQKNVPTWGVGFHVGVGGMLPAGSLSDDLKGCALFAGGFDVEYKRMKLNLGVSYGQPSLKDQNPNGAYDSQGRDLQLNASTNPTLLGFTGLLGYTVWQRGSVSVSPMVGVTQSRLSWDINHIKYEKDEEGIERPMIEDVTGKHSNCFGWTVDVDVDIKLHGKLVGFPSQENRQSRYTSSLRISPFVNFLNRSSKGCSVGITFCYAGMLHSLL